MEEYIMKMDSLHQVLLLFIESENKIEENFQNLIQIFEDHKIRDKSDELKMFFALIVRISNNLCRPPNFFQKIERILLFFKEEITEKFTKEEIFNLFKNNKRILLFLFEEKIITMNQKIADLMRNSKYRAANYPQYFTLEIRPFFTEEEKDPSYRHEKLFQQITKELPNDFEEKRKIGENDDFLCEMIRKDQIDEFITYVNRTNLKLNSVASKSIYETNSYLNKKIKIMYHYPFHPTLIEYAAFFGSSQIFKYLYLNGAKIESELFKYAIHGNNPEIIHLLEENKNIMSNINFLYLFGFAIKCHHNDVANYIQNNYMENMTDNEKEYITMTSIKSYNFAFIQNDIMNAKIFYKLCKYDYAVIVKILIQNKVDFNINDCFIFFINLMKFLTQNLMKLINWYLIQLIFNLF